MPGKIVRRIKGIPDESTRSAGDLPAQAGTVMGFKFRKNYLKGLRYSVKASGQIFIGNLKNSTSRTKYETEADIYNFNFCGYSGCFERTTSESEKDTFAMYDLSETTKGLKITELNESGIIQIVDRNGYKYTFEPCETEIVTNPEPDIEGEHHETRIISWNLKNNYSSKRQANQI